MRIIGYTYDADIHCVGCAEKRFGAGVDALGAEPKQDSEGNEVRPVFSTDEHESAPYCGDCSEAL